MKAFLRRLFGKFKPKKEAPAPPPKKEDQPKPRKRTDSSFEPLEGRIAPALLVNPSTVQFTDTDGDLVTIKFSKDLFAGSSSTLQETLNNVFGFLDNTQHVKTAEDGGLASDVGQLALLDLTRLSASTASSPAANIDVTITATPQNGMGDDLVNVGYIKAATGQFIGLSLRNITVDGDLGQIDAGDVQKSTAIASLTVQSMGKMGTTTQGAGGSLISNITGQLGKFVVKGDFVDATMKVITGLPSSSLGKIGSITIGGKLQVSSGTTSNDVAEITADNTIGSINIGTHAGDGIFGGAGNNTGFIKAGGKIGSITIIGDLHGGAGKDSGEITTSSAIGNISISGDVWAGTGENSGRINASKTIGAVALGSLHGETTFGSGGTGVAGKNSAAIVAGDDLTSLTTTGGIFGGAGDGTGLVTSGGSITKVMIGGAVAGGAGANSGRVSAASMGTVMIGQTLTGGAGVGSGSIMVTGNIGSVTIKNLLGADAALVAGKGTSSGAVGVGGNLGTVTITGDFDGLRGGELDGHTIDVNGSPVAQVPGVSSASVQAGGSIAKITVTGSLIGGPNENTAAITAGTHIGPLKITGDLVGGAKQHSGSVVAGGRITSVLIEGTLHGGDGDNSGALMSGIDVDQNGDLLKAVVTGGLQGGTGTGSGSLRAGGKLVSLTLGVKGGATTDLLLHGGIGGGSGSVFAEQGMGLINILGSVQGGTGINSGALLSTGAVSSVKLAGALTGGVGDGSGSIQVHDLDLIVNVRPGDLGVLAIGGAVTGNNGVGSGQILIEGSAKSLTLGTLVGGAGAGSGSLSVGGGVAAMANDYMTIGGAAKVTINGALTGGTGAGSGLVDVAGRLGAATVEGAATHTSILAGRDLGKLTISGAVDHALVSAQGKARPTAKTDLTIGAITITGAVSNSQFIAGYDRFGNPMNGGAQIGKVSVTGDWTASSLVAGVQDVNGDGYGNADDVAIAGDGPVSKIASIIVTGKITGTAGGGDHFGFIAQQILSAKFGGVAQALDKNNVDVIDLPGDPVTNDTSLREIS